MQIRHVTVPPGAYVASLEAALGRAARLGKIAALKPVASVVDGVFSLAQYQSPAEDQLDRGSCWAFAGAAALEAAYNRKFGQVIDVSEQYVFHMGKAFALNRDAGGNALTPVENNSSLTGNQGAGDIVQKLTMNAIPAAVTAPYLSQSEMLAFLPTLGYANVAALATQEDFDAAEFCEQNIPLLAQVNARYRAAGWAQLPDVQIATIENAILSLHEVVVDVSVLTSTPNPGHCLILYGFDRNRQVFQAKNQWRGSQFIEIRYANDPLFQINAGWYITDVVDPTFVQTEAAWLGNWWLSLPGETFRVLLRRGEDFANPGQPTRLGHAYRADGRHDVDGRFLAGSGGLELFIAPTTGSLPPGTLSGMRIDASLDPADMYNQSGITADGVAVTFSRFTTKFAAIFEVDDGTAWESHHGVDGATYQTLFTTLGERGLAIASVCGYSEGRDARFAAVWHADDGTRREGRHNLTAGEYQAEFDHLVAEGFRMTCISGYAINGEARYAAIFEQSPGPDWQARHGLSGSAFQAEFDKLASQGYVLVQSCGYRVNVDRQFAGLWQRLPIDSWEAHTGLTDSQYSALFAQLSGAGKRLTSLSGYSDTGIARYASIWQPNDGRQWQARHGLNAAAYQAAFDDLRARGFRPRQVCGYGDGFYPA